MVKVLEGGEGEIEIKKDLMNAVFLVKKVYFFHFIRNGPYDQVSIIWELDHGGVFLADQLETRPPAVFGMPALESEREPDIGTAVGAFGRRAIGVKSFDMQEDI